METPRFLGPERFAALRAMLEESGFTEPEICKRVGVAKLCDIAAWGEERDSGAMDTADAVLLRLFLDREPAPVERVRRALGAGGFEILEEFGLVRAHPADAAACLGTVMLYPTHGLYIASDRDWEPETGRGKMPRADAVYLSITPNAYDFLAAIPSSPCEDFLDMCSGTGVAGLIAARSYAKAAWAGDIAERCTRFAEWNAALNGIGNLTAVTGNFYEPFGGRTFDRIAAHPPYAPASENEYVFRDAGEDGERITRGIVEGLGDALRPGGQCYLTCAVSERKGAPAEARLREMLGEREGEFDVFVVGRRRIDPEGFAAGNSIGARRVKELGIESYIYCSIGIQRRISARGVFTIRKSAAAATGAAIEWVLRWEAMQREEGFERRLLRERLRPAEGVRLEVTHSLAGGKWVAGESRLIADKPFRAEEKCPAWVAAMLEICARGPTAREALEALKAREAIPVQATVAEFAQFVRMLVSAGMLEIESLRLPVV